MKAMAIFLSLSFFTMGMNQAGAWENHALGTSLAFAAITEVTQIKEVKAERLEDFIQQEREGLAKLLKEEEEWAIKNVASYPPRPIRLAFGAQGSNPRDSFLRAIRVNPQMKLPLYLQRLPGSGSARLPLPKEFVTLLPHSLKPSEDRFVALQEKDDVPALDVLSSASDEPDYGLDIGLWEDNGTEFGREYRFGKQPFGNPVVEFSSQAPFHMGFYHESPIVYLAASFLKRTFPEYRIHLYSSLARYALRHRHPYWGLRFAGWGLHYVQDLTQPYHALVFPGVNITAMLWMNLKDMLGFHEDKRERIQLVTNRHFALENLEFFMLSRALETHDENNPIVRALKDQSGDGKFPPFGPHSPRQIISSATSAMATRVDSALEKSLPPLLVSNPDYLFGSKDSQINVLEILAKDRRPDLEVMSKLLGELMGPFGIHSRSFFRSIL